MTIPSNPPSPYYPPMGPKPPKTDTPKVDSNNPLNLIPVKPNYTPGVPNLPVPGDSFSPSNATPASPPGNLVNSNLNASQIKFWPMGPKTMTVVVEIKPPIKPPVDNSNQNYNLPSPPLPPTPTPGAP